MSVAFDAGAADPPPMKASCSEIVDDPVNDIIHDIKWKVRLAADHLSSDLFPVSSFDSSIENKIQGGNGNYRILNLNVLSKIQNNDCCLSPILKMATSEIEYSNQKRFSAEARDYRKLCKFRTSRSASPSRELSCFRRSGYLRNIEEIFCACEFEVICDIGKGFYGVARKVVHKDTGRVLVLKEMLRDNSNYINTFKQELRLLRRIRHPHILNFIGIIFHTDDSISFLVDYMAGGSLNKIIHRSDILLSWNCRIGYARDISLGMKYLHSLNIIHRDLNSYNCLLKADNTVVVADFGLSYIVVDNKSKKNYYHNQMYLQSLPKPDRYNIVGSPYWMAPEMLKNQKYDERVDVFSFGIVLCEIIGRIEADPDFLPRTSDFGLNVLLFKQKLCSKNCPKRFLEITVSCCDTDPTNRPSFISLVPSLRSLCFITSDV